MSKVKILAFAGSTRQDSFNKKLLKIGVQAAKNSGAEVTVLELRDLHLPLYDGDLEDKEGLPPNGRKLKDLMLAHQGFLISAPEYNSSISGVLKNTIDWASRPVEGEPYLNCFTNKICFLTSASPGGLGGLRGLVHLRSLLENIGVIVIPNQVSISKANEAFDADGSLKDKRKEAQIQEGCQKLVDILKKLHEK